MSEIRGEGFTAHDRGDYYVVLLDGPLSPEQRDIVASRAVDAIEEEEGGLDFGEFLGAVQQGMFRAACGGMDLGMKRPWED